MSRQATLCVLSSHYPKGLRAYIGPAVFLLLWSAVSYSGLVSTLLLPPPDRVWHAALDIGPSLFTHFAFTLARVLIGYLVAAVLGSALGVAMQYYRSWYAVLDGLIETWRPVPPVALVPFFILVFGFSELGRLLLVVLGATLVITVTLIESLDRVPASLVRFGLISGISRWSLFRQVLIPAALPGARAGFRLALALSLTLVVVSEFLGAQYGLGYLVSVSKVTFTTPTMYLCILLLGLIGFLLDLGVRAVFHYLSFWEPATREAVQ